MVRHCPRGGGGLRGPPILPRSAAAAIVPRSSPPPTLPHPHDRRRQGQRHDRPAPSPAACILAGRACAISRMDGGAAPVADCAPLGPRVRPGTAEPGPLPCARHEGRAGRATVPRQSAAGRPSPAPPGASHVPSYRRRRHHRARHRLRAGPALHRLHRRRHHRLPLRRPIRKSVPARPGPAPPRERSIPPSAAPPRAVASPTGTIRSPAATAPAPPRPSLDRPAGNVAVPRVHMRTGRRRRRLRASHRNRSHPALQAPRPVLPDTRTGEPLRAEDAGRAVKAWVSP